MSERNYWQRMRRRRMSRRALLGASARAGVGAAGLALVGCGDDDDDDGQAAAQVQQQQQAMQQQAQQQAMQQQQQQAAEQQAQQADQQHAMQQEADQQQAAVAAASDIVRGGTRTAPFVGPYSGNPPTLDPYENLTYRAQIPSGFHYSKLIQAITGREGVNPINLAEYEPDLSASMPEIPDDTTFVFQIRDDATWHDVEPLNGRQVTLDDIVMTHDRFQEISPNAAGWNDVVSAFEPGEDNSLTFKLHRPHAPFLTLAGSSQHLWVIPQEIVDDGTVAQRPVGSGAWIFDSYEPDVALNWRRNPNWHRSNDYGHDLPLMDGIVATMNGDTNVLIPALGEGSLDFSQLSPAIYKQALEAAPQIEEDGYVFTPNTVPGGFYFNFSIPPWNDVRVRQALSLAMNRNDILSATDDTGRGGWMTGISQLPPYWMDPQDLDKFGETFEGEDSGILFHRGVALSNDEALQKARELLSAAGYPEGISATVHHTPDYGATVVNFYEACTLSASEGGFQFEYFGKEYAAYIASIFRGNFPDDWDGESTHLAIGPLYGGATDPEDLFAACYARTSGRHNWGSAARTPDNIENVLALDTGGNAGPENWTPHPNAAVGGGPETDERLHEMFDVQKGILDLEERIEYINDIQRYMATKMYIVPYTAAPGVYAFNPWMKQIDVSTGQAISATPRIWPKATYGWGQESEHTFMLDQSIKDEYV
ncbi:MAG: ABC transporter substrate-binding protein [Chloroflexi bacterium]|nr:ABC transporter substrate-binding protein [Chloroflexota bacterium]